MVSKSHHDLTEAGHPRLFVVDDEPSIRAAIRRFLTRRGWEVEEAEDGRMARSILLDSKPNHFDVVMCDLRMPHLSGSELHAELLEKRPDIVDRLIFSTGDVASADAATFLAESERPVIEKPFELSHLEQVLDSVRHHTHPSDSP